MRVKLNVTPRVAVLGVGVACLAFFYALPSVVRSESDVRFEPRGAAAAAAQRETPAEVMHFWNSGSERNALNEIRDAYTQNGGAWIDNPQPSHPDLRRALMDRLSTGTPPMAVLWQSNVELRDLAELGLFANLDAVATREDWDSALTPAVRDRVKIDGHYYMAPTNIHGLNWVFYSKTLLDRLGIAEPRTWPELFEAMRQVRAAGARPLAIGDQDWEGQVMFTTVLAGALGRDDYRRMIANEDGTVLDQENALEAFRIFAELRAEMRRNPPYAGWADASRAIAQGEAAFQFMGDWAKGEMARYGATPGREIGCMLAPGSQNALVVTIDGFAFPNNTTQSAVVSRGNLASVMFSRDVQQRFGAAKGALPARLDAAAANLDRCESIAAARLRDPLAALEPPNAGLPSAPAGDFQTAVSAFYSDPGMSPEAGRARLRAVFR